MNPHVSRENEAQPRSDPERMVSRLERLLGLSPDAPLPRALLGKESLWKGLPPDLALRWANLAEVAGLFDLAEQVLSWTNEAHPEFPDAWRGRLELLRALGRESEAAAIVRGRPDVFEEIPNAGPDPVALQAAPSPSGKTEPREADIGAPFELMRREEEQLARFLLLFQGREDCFARQWVDRKTSSQGYMPVRRPIEPADVRDHVRGIRTYGIYLLQKDSRVRLAVIDADLAKKFRGGGATSRDRDALRREKSYLLDRLPEIGRGLGMDCLVEFSGGKGFHFWYFFTEPVAASAARSALQEVARRIEPDLSCFTLEIFPKQDQLAGKGLGNLVKLPLGIHKATGKRSFFVSVADRSTEAQLAHLAQVRRIPAERVLSPDSSALKGRVVAHPTRRAQLEAFPELQLLSDRCTAIGQILSGCRRSRQLSVREEKILFGTLGFLPRGRALLHHVLQSLPEYNPHLTDYKLSRLRGTPLGCRRIHSLLNLARDLCELPPSGEYPHPLLHCPEWSETSDAPRAERCTNLEDALESLKVAIGMVQRFLQPPRARAQNP